MGNISLGLNLEFSRANSGSLRWALDQAAEIGYAYVEPMAHWGRELLSAAGYFHSISLLEDPLEIRSEVEQRGLRVSSLSCNAPLAKPDVAVDYLRQGIRFAQELGAPMIMVDDGPMPAWTSDAQNETLMTYTLTEALRVAERRGMRIGVETHGDYTATPERIRRLQQLVPSDAMTINLDTGNAYLSENDPAAWLEELLPQTVHIHAKDIAPADAAHYRGRVRGMLGTACGSGVLDWDRMLRTLAAGPNDVVVSVECASVADARASFEHLNGLLAAHATEAS
ncbi:sugar phosphate isomerase/epimerase family protein [Leucobacter musarum]|uniref:sugar phosphate isomerase/epimerase family protein n=1 Tax=Leucobacter musarum TaxID=1930747 RepID=UPI0006A76262|nr:sugar phosphate isomerase/epimerase [Leucobacter musarum]